MTATRVPASSDSASGAGPRRGTFARNLPLLSLLGSTIAAAQLARGLFGLDDALFVASCAVSVVTLVLWVADVVLRPRADDQKVEPTIGARVATATVLGGVTFCVAELVKRGGGAGDPDAVLLMYVGAAASGLLTEIASRNTWRVRTLLGLGGVEGVAAMNFPSASGSSDSGNAWTDAVALMSAAVLAAVSLTAVAEAEEPPDLSGEWRISERAALRLVDVSDDSPMPAETWTLTRRDGCTAVDCSYSVARAGVARAFVIHQRSPTVWAGNWSDRTNCGRTIPPYEVVEKDRYLATHRLTFTLSESERRDVAIREDITYRLRPSDDKTTCVPEGSATYAGEADHRSQVPKKEPTGSASAKRGGAEPGKPGSPDPEAVRQPGRLTAAKRSSRILTTRIKKEQRRFNSLWKARLEEGYSGDITQLKRVISGQFAVNLRRAQEAGTSARDERIRQRARLFAARARRQRIAWVRAVQAGRTFHYCDAGITAHVAPRSACPPA